MVGERKYVWAALQHSSIKEECVGLWEKERMLSIIASNKRWIDGHKLRHEAITRYRKYLDVYGNGYNDFIDTNPLGKVIALAPYYFTIIIPNTVIDDWFSDQITEAFSVGTIPIFRGTKNVHKYFNIDGIIQFDNLDELGEIIPKLSKDLYQSKQAAILDNLERSKQYITVATWLYENKKDFLENLKPNK